MLSLVTTGIAGRWKSFVALYGHRVPGALDALLGAHVLTFSERGVRVRARSGQEHQRLVALKATLEAWLRDWFGADVPFTLD